MAKQQTEQSSGLAVIHPSPACPEGDGAKPQFPHSKTGPGVREFGAETGPRRILPHCRSLFALMDEGF